MLWLSAAVMATAINVVHKTALIRHYRGISIFLVLWLLPLAVSTTLSPAPWESFFGSAEHMQGLFAMILYAVHFLICIWVFTEARYQKTFFNVTIGIGAVLSGYAILQYFNLDPLDLADITDASGRAFATLGHPNFLGQWLIFPVFVLLIHIYVSFRPTPSESSSRGGAEESLGGGLKKGIPPCALMTERGRNNRRCISGLLLLLIFAALLTTLNRASMLGIGIALALFFILKTKVSWKKILTGTVVMGLVTIGFFSSGGLRSILTRSVLIKSSLPLVLQHPLFGTGPESFYQTIQPQLSPELYETEHMFTLPDRVHNELLQTLLDQGVFGMSLYFFMIGFLIWIVVKRRLKTPAANIAFFSIVAALISVQFSFSLTVHWVFLMAMWAILLNETISLKTKTLTIKNPLAGAGVLAVGTVIGIILLVRAATLMAADILFDQSIQEVISEGQSSALQRAVERNPWNREYLYHGISFMSVLPNPKEKILIMEHFLNRLKKLTGENFQYHLAAAEVATLKGNVESAKQHFVEASGQAPNWPYVYLLWGDFAYEASGCENAVPHYERLIELAPSYWNEPSGEKARIFRKGHQLFFDAVERLKECNKYK